MKEKQWYSYNSFKFTKAQVKWALANVQMLRDGQWPPSHKESGYVGEAHSKQVSHEGKFIKAASIAAELDLRIQKAGLDGLMLEFLYAFEPDDELFVIEHMAQCLNLEVKEVSRRIRNALYFVSGAERKKGSYKQYVRDNQAYLKVKE